MNNIKKARQEAKLSQAGMAKALEIPVRTIQDWEYDRRTPPLYVQKLVIAELKRIAKQER